MRKFNEKFIPAPKEKSFTLPTLPLDIEIGCGVGFHPVRYALENPNRFLVAIEHTKDKFLKFQRRYENHQSPSNLYPVHENGISWVTHLLPNESVDRFIFLYPNPNPKPSQQNKRFHAMPFMEKVLSCLKPGGTIHFATNEDFYALECIEFMTNIWKLDCIKNEQITNDSNFVARTHFEVKYLKRGQKIFDLIFKKRL